jgi:hypothetical protein
MPHRQRKGGEGDILPLDAAHVQTFGPTCHLPLGPSQKTRIVKSWSVGCGVAATMKADWSDTTSSADARCQPPAARRTARQSMVVAESARCRNVSRRGNWPAPSQAVRCPRAVRSFLQWKRARGVRGAEGAQEPTRVWASERLATTLSGCRLGNIGSFLAHGADRRHVVHACDERGTTCAYRKLKSGRNDGEGRRGLGVNE